jgi:hypothetical protein
VHPIKALDVGDEFEGFDPLIRTEEVEVGGTDEINGAIVFVEKSSDVRNSVKWGLGCLCASFGRGFLRGVIGCASGFWGTHVQMVLKK